MKFNTAALEILKHLFANHPVRTDAEEFLGLRAFLERIWDHYESDDAAHEDAPDDLQVMGETLYWLKDAQLVNFDEMQGHQNPVKVRLTPAGYAAMRNLTERKYWNWFKRVSFDEYIKDAYDSRKTQRLDRLFNLLRITRPIG